MNEHGNEDSKAQVLGSTLSVLVRVSEIMVGYAYANRGRGDHDKFNDTDREEDMNLEDDIDEQPDLDDVADEFAAIAQAQAGAKSVCPISYMRVCVCV